MRVETELYQKMMNDVANWSDSEFGYGDRTVAILHHLERELSDELIPAISDKTGFDNISMEFADCFMLLFDAATHYGLNSKLILSLIEKKLEINKTRKWGPPDENGVAEHIKL